MSDRSPSVQRRILQYSRPARHLLYLTIALGFAAAVTVVAQAWLLSDVISRVFVGHESLSDVRTPMTFMVLLALARSAFVWASDALAQRSASHLKGSLRADLTQRLFALGPAFTRGERSGELVSVAVQGVEDLDEYITQYQPMRALAALVPVFVALAVFAIDPLTVLILLVTGPLLILFLGLIGSRAKDLTERRFLELNWMSASFLDMLQGLATLKLFGRSREQIENIRDISRRYGDATMEVLRTAFETALVLELSTTIATALVAVEISLRLMDGGLPFARALAVLIITPEFFFPLRQLAVRYHAGAAGTAAAARIFAILDAPPIPADGKAPAVTAAVPAGGDVRLEHVSFSYDRGRRPALRDVSISIPRGHRVALVGASGAGKTTVASLLLRFVEPDAGSISAGGVPLTSLDQAAWRSQIAWVPQQPHLFYGTVAENIRLARGDATQEAVLAAAKAAHADEFIARLPQGYDTVIGERGSRLSGGEQQRLAIARAFLKDAPFIILDEATSHLDAESEAKVRDALERLLDGRTVLIIAHRLNLAYQADEVVVLEQGRVVDAGAHRALLARDSVYRRLVASYESGTL
jgi:ATP-binding cassette subfamily C protein CydD